MKILGFNLEHNSYGLPLDNGGACLVVDGEVKMLINEERLTRKQYDAGFVQSINYILENNNLSIDDIDLFVASSCLDIKAREQDVQKQLEKRGFSVPLSKIRVCGHHLSHAYSAFWPSPFEKAIVMVLDGDGNMLGNSFKSGTKNQNRYWENQFEHSSYFLGNGKELDLLEREEIGPQENGFGGVYRYFTYFCGFPGYKYAGKLMGLSAYGSKRNRFKDVRVFELLPEGKVTCLVPDSDRTREGSPKVIERWLAEHGINISARKPTEEINEDIEDVAWLIQRELDRALIHKVKHLVEKTGIKNLCIAGGVGLNAVSNRALLDHAGIENIYIQPAAGDSGQCLGDAFWALNVFDSAHAVRKEMSVYQGKEYSEAEILDALSNEPMITHKKLDLSTLTTAAAHDIAEGKVVGWFQGRSEMGPRALGNRSIVADPRNPEMKDILNHKVKHREHFRPFAPSVLAEEASKWFDISVPAPYMILNADVLHPDKMPSGTHFDGSARIQTVRKEDNGRYHALISAFFKETGVPIVLNTSLNDNESVPETPRDALNTFLRTGIDVLYVGCFRVEKPTHMTSREARMEAIANEWSTIAAQTKKIQKAKGLVFDGIFTKLVRTYVSKGGKIFDYYCEWGEHANILADKGYAVTAINESERLLASAKKKFTKPTFLTKEEFYKTLPLLEHKFDMVYSNLWLCITKKEEHGVLIENMKRLLNDNGTLLLSFCHPAFDDMRDSIVTHRILPANASYEKEFQHTKIVHENGLEFTDYHRPLEYYVELFKKHGLEIVDIAESDTLGTQLFPDFIYFVLRKK